MVEEQNEKMYDDPACKTSEPVPGTLEAETAAERPCLTQDKVPMQEKNGQEAVL